MACDFLYEDSDFVYNTVTLLKAKKPAQESFVSQDNLAAVNDRLFETPDSLQLTVIPTWSCNLRCPFCFVLHRLERNFENFNLDSQKLKQFITNHKDKYHWQEGSLLIIGGEPLLNPGFCLEAIKTASSSNCKSHITTNLSINLEEIHLDVLKNVSLIQVSLDGMEAQHNRNRKVLYDSRNPTVNCDNVFLQVITNLKKLVKAIPPEKITIATSLIKSNDNAFVEELVFILKSLGINNIAIGYVAESDHFNVSKEKKLTGQRLVTRPCCCHRFMRHFVLEGNKLSTNYFYSNEEYQLGDLDTDLGIMEEKYRKIITNTMPILQDKNCLSCEALGFCWGQCDGHMEFKDKKPSELCDQKNMIAQKNAKLRDKAWLNKAFVETK